MGILYPLVILSLVATCIVLNVSGIPHDYLWLVSVYGWIPGILGLLWSRKDNIKLILRPKCDRYFFASIFGGLFVGASTFFIELLWLGSSDAKGFSGIENAMIYFLSYYVLFLFLFYLSFLGGEICWRGYLWERMKNRFYRGPAIWLLWNLWMVPATIIFSKSLIEMMFTTLSLTPILYFFRERTGSIGPGTLFCASLYASLIYFHMLFPLNSSYYPAIQNIILIAISGALVFSKSYKIHTDKK